MIDGGTGFMLPLMHHFVQHGVHGFAPSVLHDMFAGHDDFRRHVLAAGIVVRKSGGHAARQANGYGFEGVAEVLDIELSMRFDQLRNQGDITGARWFGASRRRCAIGFKLQDQITGRGARRLAAGGGKRRR